jgi:hypothetical protein
MGRYRKTDPRMYGDERFQRLSKPQPNGQTLFRYLFTGPHTTNIPGLFTAGEAGLAEALGWPLKAFREAFREGLVEALRRRDPEVPALRPISMAERIRTWRIREAKP